MELNDIKLDPRDLRHPTAALEYIEYLQETTRQAILDTEGIPSMLALISVMRDPETGLDLTVPEVLMISSDELQLSDSGRDKQILADLIRELSRKLSAVLVCVISEAWTIKAESEEDKLLAQEWVRKHGDISECPLRNEVALIQTDHKLMSPRNQLWSAPITLVDGVRTVGDFTNIPNSSDSRFSNLLP